MSNILRTNRPTWQIVGSFAVVILVFYPLLRFHADLGIAHLPFATISPNDVYLTPSDRGRHASSLRRLKVDLGRRFPVGPGREPRDVTLNAADKLADCLETDTCKEAQKKVIILASYHFGQAISGLVAGEDIWARSTMEAFNSLGYTLLITYDTLEAVLVYQAIPELVKMVIWETHNLRECLAHGRKAQGIKDSLDPDEPAVPSHLEGEDEQAGDPTGKGCFKTKEYLTGIPIHKLFSFHFWADGQHPLGGPWTLSPENYVQHGIINEHNRNTYLGYSIETWCKQNAVHPGGTRENHAFIYAKKLHYFDEGMNLFYEQGTQVWRDLKQAVGINFLSAVDTPETVVPDEGVDNIGRQPQADFYATLASSKALVGLGEPWLSPTPYDALCVGLPFVNPIHTWNEDDPEDRNHWNCQHNGLLWEDAPYVYHVHAHNTTELQAAIEKAAANPIGRYIPANMTRDATRERHRAIVETDWEGMAIDLMAERRSKGERTYLI